MHARFSIFVERVLGNQRRTEPLLNRQRLLPLLASFRQPMSMRRATILLGDDKMAGRCFVRTTLYAGYLRFLTREDGRIGWACSVIEAN